MGKYKYINSEYLDSLKNCQPISKDEQLVLYRKMKVGCIDARNKLVESCLQLSIQYVLKFCKYFNIYYVTDDLIQDASVIAIRAVELWNPDKGCLTTFVSNSIIRSLSRNIYNKYYKTPLKIPVHTYKEAQSNIICDKSHNRMIDINFAKNLMKQDRISSDTFKVADNVPTKNSDLEEIQEEFQKIALLINELTVKEKELLNLRFVHSMKLKDIGVIFNTTKEAVRQRLGTIMRKLRIRLNLIKAI